MRFWFSKALSNKISIALILKRKSCICCRKHCIAYFRRHMECAVLKRFLKVQGTFFKKFLQIPLFHLEKLNLIRFIKTLIKGFSPNPLRFAQHLLPEEKALNPSVKPSVCHLPCQGRLIIGNFTVNLKIPWLCHGILLKV